MAHILSVAPYGSANTPYKRAVFLPVVIDVAGGTPSINTALSAAGCTVADTNTGIITVTIPVAPRGVVMGCNVVAVDGTALQAANVESYAATTGTVVINTYTAADATEADITGAIHLVLMIEGG